ncbi:hypothetical protein [Nocardioides pantholopis]|uniref:hypothetical protein n=1 Tax=Nocardioides pantholopis TaxID=2483798 RepID=UPI0013DDD20D|nr:hypothetical protein [Nocardioides pantholopis]
MSPQPADQRGPVLTLLLLALVGLLVVAWGAGAHGPRVGAPAGAAEATQPSGPTESAAEVPAPAPDDAPDAAPEAPGPTTLPHGGRRVFEDGRFLVAYYGTAGSGALGVLGEDRPAVMDRRLRRTAAAYARPGRPVQPVYELIVTIADRAPGRDGDYNHDLARAEVRRYLRAAHRHGALLLLDIQPGRADFLQVAKRWAWALRDPYVGLALDPEWRMPRGTDPGQVIGHVRAAEVNRTSAWLARLVRRHDLPEKLFVLHQFRTAMLPDIERIRQRPGLAAVQHVDGFGTRTEKMATFRAVARPRQFRLGMKVFYDEDVRRMGAPAVHRIRPRVGFVSYQ